MGKFIKIRNRITGKELQIDTKMDRYRRMSQAFINSLKLEARFLKHITLTQSYEQYKPRMLKNLLMALRRRYPNTIYIWCVEIQEERLKKYGEAVLHWHILTAFQYDVGLNFGAEDIEKIVSYWKFGGVQVSAVRKPSVSYLLKYMTKALNTPIEYNVRRMGSSKLPGYLRQSWKKLSLAINTLTSRGMPLNQWEDCLSWDYRGGFVVVDHEIRLRRGRLCRFKNKFYVYKHPKTDWYVTVEDDMVPAGVEDE